MTRLKSFQHSRLSLSLLMCVMLLVAVIWSSGAKPFNKPQTELSVVNKTRAFMVLSVAQEGNSIKLTLRNGYDKDINGYTISTGKGAKDEVDLGIGDRVITPGESVEYKGSLLNSQSAPGETVAQQPITILAVMFTDHTSDGDPTATSDFDNRRLGMKKQLKRMLPLVDAALNSPDADTPAAIARLKSQISNLSEEADGTTVWTVKRGLRAAKEDLLREIQDLEMRQQAQGIISFRRELLKVKDKYEKRASKL